MRLKSPTLTAHELEIMKIVWELDSATVRDVYEALLKHRKIAYTTVMTVMRIMEQKRYLTKRADGRAYVYRPARPKKQMIREMVGEFVNRVFNGSARPLVAHLIEDRCLSKEDLEEIARMVRNAK